MSAFPPCANSGVGDLASTVQAGCRLRFFEQGRPHKVVHGVSSHPLLHGQEVLGAASRAQVGNGMSQPDNVKQKKATSQRILLITLFDQLLIAFYWSSLQSNPMVAGVGGDANTVVGLRGGGNHCPHCV